MSTLYTRHANDFHAHPSPLCDLARFEEKLDLKAVATLDDACEIARIWRPNPQVILGDTILVSARSPHIA